MNSKWALKILPATVGIGFCLIEAIKILFLTDASPVPDAASGRTEPTLFAPAISTDWSYITGTQIMILTWVTGAVLVLAAAMLVLQWKDHIEAHAVPADPDPVQPHPSQIPPRPGTFSFGRRG